MPRAVLLASMLATATLAALGADNASTRTPQPTITPAKPGTSCIAPPAQMRREHPRMLSHQRDETVHGGVRGAEASLKGCIECHASAATRSVAKAPGDFCVSCHTYAAVKVDCFGCHASTAPPNPAAERSPLGHASLAAPAAPMRAPLEQGRLR